LYYAWGGWRTAEGCTGVAKISYNGACSDPDLVPVIPLKLSDLGIEVHSGQIHITQPGAYQVAVFNVRGKVLKNITGSGPGILKIPQHQGIVILKVKTSNGFAIKKLAPESY